MNFDGFWEGILKQVSTKIGTEIDTGIKAEKSSKRQPASAKLGSEGPRREAKPIKNRSKIEVQNDMPLRIDFSKILVGYGRQVGQENRTKMLSKSISKDVQKTMPLK